MGVFIEIYLIDINYRVFTIIKPLIAYQLTLFLDLCLIALEFWIRHEFFRIFQKIRSYPWEPHLLDPRLLNIVNI